MAQRTVQLIIGQILTDEEFRSDFSSAHPKPSHPSAIEASTSPTGNSTRSLTPIRGCGGASRALIDARLQRCRLVGGQRK